jgi:hypothetical protein
LRFVAFLATEYDEVFLSYQLGQMVEDKDRDGLQNTGFFTTQPYDPADSPRKLHHIQRFHGNEDPRHSHLSCDTM